MKVLKVSLLPPDIRGKIYDPTGTMVIKVTNKMAESYFANGEKVDLAAMRAATVSDAGEDLIYDRDVNPDKLNAVE